MESLRAAEWNHKYWDYPRGEMMKRPPTSHEVGLVRKIAERLSPEVRQQLLDDLAGAQAESLTPDGSRVGFLLRDYERPPYRGEHSFGVEGHLNDSDGTRITVDLHADENGRLLELELIRWGRDPLIDPDWSSLELY